MKLSTTRSQPEDEESLLQLSPVSITSSSSDFVLTPKATWRLIPRLVLNALYHVINFAIPSFLRRPSSTTVVALNEKAPLTQKKYTTEYLDGVRGLASFIVFIFHWTHLQFPGTNTGYGARDESSLWQLPIIRFVYSGAAMVSIFFVVSGYVLTHRFIQKMYRHEYESLFASLTSLTFRRTIRLFLPAAASCFLAFICASLGLFPIPKTIEHHQFKHGWLELFRYMDRETNPWTWDAYMKGFYNPQLWSIAVEYRGSMVVFLTVLALAKTRPLVRMATECGIVAHCFAHKRWDVALFIAGMLVAEVDVFCSVSASRKAFMQEKRVKLFLIITMIAGIWLSGFPRDDPSKSWGYGFLDHFWPFADYRRRFWLAISSILIVGPLPFMPSLQILFCSRPIRYLGKISFALYLIHGLGNRTIGIWIMRLTWDFFGRQSYLNNLTGYVVASVIYIPIIIWWSDIYWRAIDIPATNFAKWFEGKCASAAPT